MYRFLAILLCLSFVQLTMQAQKIDELKNYDTMVYVFKLDYEQTKFILERQQIVDTGFLFTKKFKEISRSNFNAEQLPNGHFVIAQIDDANVHYSYKAVMPFSVSSKVIDDEIILFLKETKSKQRIRQAKLVLQGKLMPYDAGVGGYVIKQEALSLKRGFIDLKISYDGEIYTQQFIFSEGGKESKPADYYQNTNGLMASPGYLVLDKPLYKPNDSLHLKAYLINFRNGNGLRKKVQLTITQPNTNYVFEKKLKSTSRGAYLFDWKLPDSLKLDYDYTVRLDYAKKGRNFFRSKNFKLEQYELNKNTYSLDVPNEIFYAGDDINAYVSAKDMNGFPVQGTMLHVELRINEVNTIFTDTFRLSPEMKKVWYSLDTVIEYDNFIPIKIASNKLPNANARYTLIATFVDPLTFEKKAITKDFVKFCQSENRLFYQQEDSVHVRNLHNGKDTVRSYVLFRMSGKDTLTVEKIKTPFHTKLLSLETQLVLMDKDSMKTPLNLIYNRLDIVHVKGKRTGDSIQISFKYPFAEALHYRIYKKDKLIESGMKQNLNFTMLDQSSDEYRIVFSHDLHEGLEANFYEVKFIPEKHLLHFDKQIPSNALPGDSVPIEIVVRDYKNGLVKKANVTSYALNKAFEQSIETPYFDVAPQYQDKVSMNPVLSKDAVYFSQTIPSGQVRLKNKHFQLFNLKKNEYYQLKYPSNEWTELKIKKQQPEPEFAFFTTHSHSTFSPKYVLLDGDVVFMSDLAKDKKYSTMSTVGKHTISFRYMDRLYTMNDVQLDANAKHLFGVNFDSLRTTNSRFVRSDSLPLFEPTEKERDLLYGSLLCTNAFISDSLKVVSKNKNYQKFIYNNYFSNMISIDGDNFNAFGPYKKDEMIEMKVNTKSFTLKTGLPRVYHYDAILHEFIPKTLPTMKGAFLSFREVQLMPSQFNDLIVPDTALPKPIETQLSYQPKTAKALELKEEENFYQSYKSQIGGEWFTIHVKNNLDSNHIKSMWIISKGNFQTCDFIQGVNRPYYSTTKTSVKDTFDIYLLLNKNRMCVLRNLKFNYNDEFYINPQYLKTIPFSQNNIEVPLKIYSELNNVPLQPFNDAPQIVKSQIKSKPNAKRNNVYLHGLVTTSSMQPIADAIVYLELNGRFRYGGKTNQNGLFEMVDMAPGSYQLKIYAPGYRIQHAETMLFTAQTEYEVNTSLEEEGTGYPLFSSIQNDFRIQAYVKNEQRNLLKISAHEKNTRETLSGVDVVLMKSGKLISKHVIKNGFLEIPFPKDHEHGYELIFQKFGFTSLKLNELYFQKNYLLQLDVFMGLQQKEILAQKEFNLNMEGQLPFYEDEESEFEMVIERPSSSVDKKQGGEIYGRVMDERKQPLDFVAIVASEKGISKGGSKSDLNGNYKIKPIAPGKYTLRISYSGYQTQSIEGVIVVAGGRTMVDVQLERKTSSAIESGKEIVVKEYKVKLIDKDNPNTKSIDRKEVAIIAKNNVVSDLVALQSGTYQNNTAPISIGGDRASGTVYMIDGAPVRTQSVMLSSNYEVESLDEVAIGQSAKYGNASGGVVSTRMLDQVMNNANTSTIRKDFSDIGFWRPNLITNKQGKVAFTIKLPDNITSWKTYILGAGKHWKHGVDSADIKVYKPLQSSSIVPNYMYVGDKLLAKLKLTNLTAEPLSIQSIISINGLEKVNRKSNMQHTLLDSCWLETHLLDSITFKGGLVYNTRYKDFEQFTIPVLSTSLKSYTNQSFMMDQDSTYTLIFKPNTKGEIIFNNSLYEKVVTIVNELGKYEYGCVEQTTSKLNALLLKNKLNRKLDIKENNNKEIYQLLAKLADMQNDDGSFGWWRKQWGNARMTSYVMEICQQALQQGFQNNVANAAKTYISQHFNTFSESDQLYAYVVLQGFNGHSNEMTNRIEKITLDALNTTDKINYYQARITNGQTIPTSDLYAVFLEMDRQSRLPYYDNFFYDYRSNLFNAYRLFRNTTHGTQFLSLFRRKLISGYFDNNLNTYAKAKLIEALTTDAIADTSKPIQAKLVINQNIEIKTFPAKILIDKSQYKIAHAGGDVFVNTAEEIFESQPNKRDSVFAIRTYFQQKGKNSEALKIGEPTDFFIDIQCFKSGENVMVEVPIPSGMKIKQKQLNTNSNEFVQYDKHKVVYFFNKLSIGTHQLKIVMTPVFKGNFQLPATKVCLMYYPYVQGNNENKEVKIVE